MNQVESKIAEAKAEARAVRLENEDLDIQVAEIKENHESIQAELEYSEKLESLERVFEELKFVLDEVKGE